MEDQAVAERNDVNGQSRISTEPLKSSPPPPPQKKNVSFSQVHIFPNLKTKNLM